MSRWRIVLVIGLILVPFLFMAAMGSYYLWTLRWGFFSWWPLALCMALGYTLGWYWQRQHLLLHPPDFTALRHWTDQDKDAWRIVQSYAQAAAAFPAEKMVDLDHYVTTAREMAEKLASFYHPGTSDPLSSLTVPEILSVIELASHDLRELVDRYLPGGHLLTVRDWRRARQALDWYQPASNLYWGITALFAPLETGTRFAASKLGLAQTWQMLQQNLVLWFYTAYVHRLGTYLIELNSGRLRMGVTRYRQLMASLDHPEPSTDPKAASPVAADPPPPAPRQITIAVFGQVKAGKSSLINALLGEQRAATDVLPATAGVGKYELHPTNIPDRLLILDTVGYGHEGPKADQLAVTRETAQQADLLLLVVHARNPARQADAEMLRQLADWFDSHPRLKKPPLLLAATHIDLLSPALEWSPPYDWRQPTRAKEQNIQQALTTIWHQIGASAAGVVPVCGARGREYGIGEWLLPAMLEQLDEARGVALLRCLRAEIDENKIRKVLHQLLSAGQQVTGIVWQSLAKQPSTEANP